MTLDLNGLIPATVLPMHADGSIDEAGLRSYIGWIAQQGPVALAINVDTGEGPHLTHDEKVRILNIVRDDRDTLRTGGADPLDRRVERSLAATGHDHLRPGARERLGDGRPDRPAAARHEGDAAVEAEDVELRHRPFL